MSKSTRRVLRVSLAIVGMAVLCASFVGTASASPMSDEAADARNAVENTGAEVPEVPSRSEIADSSLLHNNVVDAELPKVSGVSYDLGAFTVVPASSPGDNEDEDGICHGRNGEYIDEDGALIQTPCQSRGNDIRDGVFEVNGKSVASLISIPGIEADGAPGVEADGGDNITQNGDSAAPLTDPKAVTKNLRAPEDLNHINNEKVAVTPV